MLAQKNKKIYAVGKSINFSLGDDFSDAKKCFKNLKYLNWSGGFAEKILAIR